MIIIDPGIIDPNSLRHIISNAIMAADDGRNKDHFQMAILVRGNPLTAIVVERCDPLTTTNESVDMSTSNINLRIETIEKLMEQGSKVVPIHDVIATGVRVLWGGALSA